MKRYEPGAGVPPGLYWSPRGRDLQVVTARDAVLRGAGGRRYARVPAVALPVVGLLGAAAGGLYVLVLPLVGVALLAWYGAAAVWHGLTAVAVRLLGLVLDDAPAGTAHFTGRPDAPRRDAAHRPE